MLMTTFEFFSLYWFSFLCILLLPPSCFPRFVLVSLSVDAFFRYLVTLILDESGTQKQLIQNSILPAEFVNCSLPFRRIWLDYYESAFHVVNICKVS